MLLVLVSVVAGARVMAAADDTTGVWVAARDLAPGSVLSAEDVVARDVQLAQPGRYLSAAQPPPVGRTVARAVGAEELVPVSALRTADAPDDRRQVTIPVERFRFPAGLRPGERVDVYLTPEPARGGAAGPTRPEPERVLSAVTVAAVEEARSGFGATSGATGVVLSVAEERVPALVGAVGRGALHLVRVPLDGAGG